MNAIITRKHINEDIDICPEGVEITPCKLLFSVLVDENEKFGFDEVEFTVEYTDEDQDEINWDSLKVTHDITDSDLIRFKKFLEIYKYQLEYDFKEKKIENIDQTLTIWDILEKNSFFLNWSGDDYLKQEFASDLVSKLKRCDIAELAGTGYFSDGISLQLLIDLNKIKKLQNLHK